MEVFGKILLLLIIFCASPMGRSGETVNRAFITSVNYVFETFSPYAMVRFFEFNDKGWNVSESCLRNMYSYLEGLRKGTIWAVKLYDATGYYNGGAFGSNNARLHNPDLCRILQREHNEMLYMHWNIRLNATVVPFPVRIVVANYVIEMATKILFKYEKIQQMVCFPRSCKNSDLSQILEIYLFQSNHIVKNMTYSSHRIVTDDYSVFQDTSFYTSILLMCSSLVFFVMVHFSSSYCSIINECGIPTSAINSELQQNEIENNVKKIGCEFQHNQQRITLRTEGFLNRSKAETAKSVNIKYNDTVTTDSGYFCLLHQIMDAVAIENVLYELFKKQVQGTSTVQTGIFVISAVMIIYAETATQMGFIASNLNYSNRYEANLQYTIRKLATYLIDVYFFVSGSNLVLKFFKQTPRGRWNVFEQILHLLTLIVSKIFSVSLSYTFALFMQQTISTYQHSNIAFQVPSFDYNNCAGQKWKNIFFLDIFFPIQQRCMPWTWFISLEVHFFTAACFVLLMAEIHPRYAGAICFTIFSISLVASTILEMDPHSQLNLQDSIEGELMQFNLIFDKVWLRVPPYLLGMSLGYILHKTNARISLNIFVVVCGWIACLLIVCFFMFGYQVSLFRANNVIRAAIITSGHIIWPTILLWIVLASITQHGGLLRTLFASKYWQTMERLSTISFIIGPQLIRLVLVSGDAPIFSSEAQIFIMTLGFSFIIYICSLLLYVCFDGPIIAVLDVIAKRISLKF